MKNVNTLNALSRKTVGSNSSRKVKNSEKIPAIIYGNGLNPEPVSLNVSELRKEVNNSTFLNKIYDLLVEKNKVRVIVQGVEQDPVTDELIHVDFLRINDNTKVTIEVPVKFINEVASPGIKRGGVLNIVRYAIEVICPVSKIPESFEFDLTGLEIGDSIHISHTKIEDGVNTTIKDRDFTVASILAPSALVSSETSEEKAEEEEEEEKEGAKEDGTAKKTEDQENKK